MTALNFPTPVTVGDTYSANGQSYVWNGTAWKRTNAGYSGSLGYTGSQGIQGFTGSIGYTGSQGVTGFTGSLGYTGRVSVLPRLRRVFLY